MRFITGFLLAAASTVVLTGRGTSAIPLPPSAATMATRSRVFREAEATPGGQSPSGSSLSHPLAAYRSRLTRRTASRLPLAMAIPGYGVAEQVFIGGAQNFLGLYNGIITVRILLSWFPQAQSIGALQPVFGITDPYLNLFRGIIPPIGGLDLSPIAAFFTLSVLTKATAAVGCELPEKMKLQCEMGGRSYLGRAILRRIPFSAVHRRGA